MTGKLVRSAPNGQVAFMRGKSNHARGTDVRSDFLAFILLRAVDVEYRCMPNESALSHQDIGFLGAAPGQGYDKTD
jgi:hypothetical protein